MAVTDEQRALLQLLLEGGQGYDDIGSLLGIGPEEVRSRARSALTEIGGGDPDAQVGVSDYLLGQADPIGRADAVRHLQSDPDANALAERLVQNLRLLAPKAQLPDIPPAKGGRRAAPAPPPAPAAGGTATPRPAPPASAPPPSAPSKPGIASRAAGAISGLGKLDGKRRTQAIAGGAAALAIVIVLVVVAGGGGGGGGGGDCKSVDTNAPQQAGVPTIKLTAAGPSAGEDCPPSGQMVLGAQQSQQQASSQTPTYVLQANAVNLPPSGSSDRYVLWLYRSDTQAVPLGQETVSDNGDLNGGVPLAAQQVLLLPAFTQVRFSKVTQAEAQQVQQSLQAQKKKATGIVPFVGEPVLQGNISELGLEQLLQQAQSQAGGSSGKKG